jgi:hypothetical protein
MSMPASRIGSMFTPLRVLIRSANSSASWITRPRFQTASAGTPYDDGVRVDAIHDVPDHVLVLNSQLVVSRADHRHRPGVGKCSF